MDRLIALATASREELLAVIAAQQVALAQLQATVTALEARIRELEAGSGKGPPTGMPGHKPEQAPGDRPKRARKPRAHGFARRRSTPTRQVVHALGQCPDCGVPLAGGWVKRRREIIDLPLPPAEVIEHVYLERECPLCRKRVTPQPELTGLVAGQQRLGVGLVSLIVTLRAVNRLPNRQIQTYLAQVHQLPLSVGAIVAAQHRVAALGQPLVEQIRDDLRSRAWVHADETGWRESGRNRYVWTFSTPTERYFLFRGRHKAVVDEVLGDRFAGVLLSDYYAAYNHYPGLHQRCWPHLLREIHELRVNHPADAKLRRWATRVHDLFEAAKAFQSSDPVVRHRAQKGFERKLRRSCVRFRDQPTAPHRILCRRIVRQLPELFVFVGEPGVPADNNPAERSLRPLVVSRKISGGTRSPQGTATKMALATLFGTWPLREVEPLDACRQLLAGSPRL